MSQLSPDVGWELWVWSRQFTNDLHNASINNNSTVRINIQPINLKSCSQTMLQYKKDCNITKEYLNKSDKFPTDLEYLSMKCIYLMAPIHAYNNNHYTYIGY